MEKRPASAVLPHQTNVMALIDQRRVRHCLGESPIHMTFATRHLETILHDALYASVQPHVRWNRCNLVTQLSHFLGADGRVNGHIPVGIEVRRPVDRVFIANHSEARFRHRLTAIQAVPVGVLHLCGRIAGDDAVAQ